MKIVFSLKEVENILEYWLSDNGYTVKKDTFDRVSHYEGQYDESREIVDGFQFDVDRLV